MKSPEQRSGKMTRIEDQNENTSQDFLEAELKETRVRLEDSQVRFSF